MPSRGGEARRLTYLDASQCLILDWRADGSILFGSNAGEPFYPRVWLYAVHPDRPTHIERLPVGQARALATGPRGGMVIGRNTGDPARWKRYRGGSAGRLWIQRRTGSDWSELLPLDGNLASPMWLQNNRIYFVSDHEGIGNIYSCTPGGRQLRRHTDHEDFYVRNARSDGTRIVYQAGADLHVFDATRNQRKRVEIEWHAPGVQRHRKFSTANAHWDGFDIGAKGQHVVITSRGQMFGMSPFEGPVARYGETATNTGAAVRHRLPIWIGDNDDVVLAIADGEGEERFIAYARDPRIPLTPEAAQHVVKANKGLAGLDIGRVTEVRANPIGKKSQLAFTNHRHELNVLTFHEDDHVTIKLIERGLARPIEGFDWAPDGEWLAYGASLSQQRSCIKLWQATSGVVHQITEPVLRDSMPSFDPAGKFLFFISHRIFQPVADNLRFDMGFPLGMVPCLIPLGRDTPSPFGTPPIEVVKADDKDDKSTHPLRNDDDEPDTDDTPGTGEHEEPPTDAGPGDHAKPAAQDQKNDEKKPDKKGQKQSPVRIDLENIQHRVVPFPVAESIYGRIMASKDGRTVFYTSRWPISQGGDGESSRGYTLDSYDLEDRKEDSLLHGVTDFDMSRDHSMIAVRSSNWLRVFRAGDKPDDSGTPRKRGWIDFDRVKISIDPVAEWRQMFREAWRLQRDNFWTADLSGVDWQAVHDRYLPLVERVSTRREFSDLMWEMQGELGTSHAYEYGGDHRWSPHFTVGRLGADFAWDKIAGAWRITDIVSGDIGRSGHHSPLLNPGANVNTGDFLLAVNGTALTETLSPSMALVNHAGADVSLLIRSGLTSEASGTAAPADPTAPVEPESTKAVAPSPQLKVVTVKPLHSDTHARYHTWVTSNRAKVHEATGGACGYVHVPDMQSAGYAEFFRGFLAEVERNALIIDVRYNTGGNISQLLLEILSRKRLGYDVSRWSQIPESYPAYTIAGPMAVLINEHSSSDGDMFPHAFKQLKLGDVIGTRTWGGVIGIWPRHPLVDGTTTTQPEMAAWFSDVGWRVENLGAEPTISQDITPDQWVAGIDAQLDRGITEIKRRLQRKPVRVPKFDRRPNRAPPRLK